MSLEIKPMRGQMLLYQLDKPITNHMIYRNGFYMVPRKDGYLLAGSTLEDVGFDTSVTEDIAGWKCRLRRKPYCRNSKMRR